MHCSGVLQLRIWRLRSSDCRDEHNHRIRQHDRNCDCYNYSAHFDNHGRRDLDYYSRDLDDYRRDYFVDRTNQLCFNSSCRFFIFFSEGRGSPLIPLSQTFPAACCPNKYDATLRPVSAGKLRRRALQFTTTLTTTTVTSTSTTTETIAAATPLATVTTTTFAEAATPLTTTSTTAFALSTACVSEVSTGLSKCPSNPKPVITALLSVCRFSLCSRMILELTNIALQAYRKSGKRFVIDCGAAGMFEQA